MKLGLEPVTVKLNIKKRNWALNTAKTAKTSHPEQELWPVAIDN